MRNYDRFPIKCYYTCLGCFHHQWLSNWWIWQLLRFSTMVMIIKIFKESMVIRTSPVKCGQGILALSWHSKTMVLYWRHLRMLHWLNNFSRGNFYLANSCRGCYSVKLTSLCFQMDTSCVSFDIYLISQIFFWETF